MLIFSDKCDQGLGGFKKNKAVEYTNHFYDTYSQLNNTHPHVMLYFILMCSCVLSLSACIITSLLRVLHCVLQPSPCMTLNAWHGKVQNMPHVPSQSALILAPAPQSMGSAVSQRVCPQLSVSVWGRPGHTHTHVHAQRMSTGSQILHTYRIRQSQWAVCIVCQGCDGCFRGLIFSSLMENMLIQMRILH